MTEQKYYNYQVFLAALLRQAGYGNEFLPGEGIYRGRVNDVLKRWETTLHYEWGSLLTMLDRRKFLQQFLLQFYSDKRLSNQLKDYKYSEVHLWDYYKKNNDTEMWSKFNLNNNADFSLDISINYNDTIFIDVEIKHKEAFKPTVIDQMCRKCAFLISPYQSEKFEDNEYLFISWNDKVDRNIFDRYPGEEYFVLTEDFKNICMDKISKNLEHNSSQSLNIIDIFLQNNGIRLITWESITKFIEHNILSQNGIDDGINQSCSDFLINLKYRYL